MIASLACNCGQTAANVSHHHTESAPVAIFAARLVAVHLGWAVDVAPFDGRPARSGVCPRCMVRRGGDVFWMEEVR